MGRMSMWMGRISQLLWAESAKGWAESAWAESAMGRKSLRPLYAGDAASADQQLGPIYGKYFTNKGEKLRIQYKYFSSTPFTTKNGTNRFKIKLNSEFQQLTLVRNTELRTFDI